MIQLSSHEIIPKTVSKFVKKSRSYFLRVYRHVLHQNSRSDLSFFRKIGLDRSKASLLAAHVTGRVSNLEWAVGLLSGYCPSKER